MLLLARRKRRKMGANTFNVFRFGSITLDKNAPIAHGGIPLKPLERPIYSDHMEESRRLQLFLISTTQVACRLALQAALWLLSSKSSSKR